MLNEILSTKDLKYKSLSQIKIQIEEGHKCTLEFCNNDLSDRRGPGSGRLCLEHQLMQREYGGLGRLDRPWTFSREWSCAWCGYNPKEDPWFHNPPIPFDNEAHMIRAQRGMLVGDHNEKRRVDGGSDGKDNVQTLCQNCNSKKTNMSHDYKRAIV
jgi:hypothetical protein